MPESAQLRLVQQTVLGLSATAGALDKGTQVIFGNLPIQHTSNPIPLQIWDRGTQELFEKYCNYHIWDWWGFGKFNGTFKGIVHNFFIFGQDSYLVMRCDIADFGRRAL